ncbi:MAG TPA: MIP/aquaporin family protein [Bryobacteraceae bacterium]|nr:MIP/aquaporin family protein [Bryobacteraceae bacterium]
MHNPLFGEFMGTLVLILMGNGTNSNVLLSKTNGNNSGWIVISTGWFLAVMAGVAVAQACGSPGAHINPAVTLAVAIISGDFSNVAGFVAAQMLGAFVGATLVWLHFLPHWTFTNDPGLKKACFCTAPAIRNTPTNIISEIIGTFMLFLIIASVLSKGVVGSAGAVAPGLVPFLVGCVVWVIGIGLGGTTGFPINPARDLGPRIAHAILPISGKGDSDWSYAMVPVIGELIGGALAGLFVKMAGI